MGVILLSELCGDCHYCEKLERNLYRCKAEKDKKFTDKNRKCDNKKFRKYVEPVDWYWIDWQQWELELLE